MRFWNSSILILLVLLVLSEIVVADPLRLATLEYPPYEYLEGGHVKGVGVEIVKEVFNRMQQPIIIKVLPWARSLKSIETGEADGIFTAFKTTEREEIAYYSKEILIPQVISFFVKERSDISFTGNLNALSKYRFGVVAKVSYGKVFDTAVKNGLLKTVLTSGNYDLNVRMLLKGRFDILVSCKPCIHYTLKKSHLLKQIKELTTQVDSLPSYIAFSKKGDLISIRDQFDVVIGQMKKDGSYQKILDRFFKRF